MRATFISRITAILLLGIECVAQSSPVSVNSNAILDLMGQIPPCGLNCLIQAIPSIGCELLDVECQCRSSNSTQIVQPCLLTSCTYEETFKLLHVQGELCNKSYDNTASSVRVTGYLSAIVPVVVIVMRFSSRWVGGSKFWWDDWLHLLAVILIVPSSILLILDSYLGLGHHVWDVTYQELKYISRYTYISTLLWAVNLVLLKFSILTLYLRIFPNVWLRRAIIAFGVFIILYAVPLILMAAFQCIPIYAIWDLEAQKTAKCVDYVAVLRATVGIEIISEIGLFLLPIPVVLKLQMQKSKKVLLLAFFGSGIVIIIISIARLPTLPGVFNPTDQTYTSVPTAIIGFFASIAGHICAAIPTIRALQRSATRSFMRIVFGREPGSLDTSRPSRLGYKSSKGTDGTGNSSRQKSHISKDNSQRNASLPPDSPSDDIPTPLADLRPVQDRARIPPHSPSQGLFSGPWSPGRKRDSRRKDDRVSSGPALYRDAWRTDPRGVQIGDGDSVSSEKELVKERIYSKDDDVEDK